ANTRTQRNVHDRLKIPRSLLVNIAATDLASGLTAEQTFARRAACQALIDQLVAGQQQITGALVSTVDGFEIAARLGSTISAAKLAAMTSSLLALGEAVSIEGGVENCMNVVIEASAG